MKTFKQSIADNRKIQIIAPLDNGNPLNEMSRLIVKTIKGITDNNLDIPLDRIHISALIETSYKLNKIQINALYESLDYMGYR